MRKRDGTHITMSEVHGAARAVRRELRAAEDHASMGHQLEAYAAAERAQHAAFDFKNMFATPAAVPVSSSTVGHGEGHVGQMYRIRYVKPGGRITLESQMKLISINHSPVEGDKLIFSARPRFGTQELRRDQLTMIKQVPIDSKVYVNWDPRKTGQPDSWPYER